MDMRIKILYDLSKQFGQTYIEDKNTILLLMNICSILLLTKLCHYSLYVMNYDVPLVMILNILIGIDDELKTNN